MVIQWGCLAKCQGTRKSGLEFRRVSASPPPLPGVVIRVKISRLQRFVNAEERTFRDNADVELPAKFPPGRIYQPSDTKRETGIAKTHGGVS